MFMKALKFIQFEFPLAILCGLFEYSSFAAPKLSIHNLPQLRQHSALDHTVKKSDRIHLKLVTDHPNYSYEWHVGDKIICHLSECIVDTQDWKEDTYTIIGIVYDRFGSRSTNFGLNVLPNEKNKKPIEHSPKLVTAKKIQAIVNKEDTVRIFNNSATLLQNNDVIKLGIVPRRLRWESVLTTAKDSGALIENEKIYNIFVYEDTRLEFRVENNRKLIEVKSGKIRARALEKLEKIHFRIICQNKVIELAKYSDITCETDAKDADFFAIRSFSGSQKIRDGSVKNASDIILPGSVISNVEFNFDEATPEAAERRNNALISMKRSSPQYLLKKRKTKNTPFYFEKRKPFPSQTLKDDVKNMYSSHQITQALERLLPMYNKERKSPLLNQLLAKTYMKLGLLETASSFAERSVRYDVSKLESHIVRSDIFFRLGNCKKSMQSLRYVLRSKEKDVLALAYYRAGVCSHKIGRKTPAKLYLTNAKWEAEDETLLNKIQKLLDELKENESFSVKGSLHLGYTTNGSLTGDSHTDENQLQKTASLFYKGVGQLGIRIKKTHNFRWSLEYEGMLRQYSESSLKNHSISMHHVATNFGFRFANDAEKNYFYLKSSSGIDLMYVGEPRAADVLFYNFRIGKHSSYPMSFIYESASAVDPVIEDEVPIDPLIMQPISKSDRSLNYSKIGLDLRVYNSKSYNIDVQLNQKSHSYKDAAVQEEDQTTQTLNLQAIYFAHKNSIKFSLLYGSRSFTNVAERIEKLSKLSLENSYQVSPVFDWSSELSYETQSSTLDLFNWTTVEIVTGLNISL